MDQPGRDRAKPIAIIFGDQIRSSACDLEWRRPSMDFQPGMTGRWRIAAGRLTVSPGQQRSEFFDEGLRWCGNQIVAVQGKPQESTKNQARLDNVIHFRTSYKADKKKLSWNTKSAQSRVSKRSL